MELTTIDRAVDEKELISGEELLALDDIGPCELVEGVIVPMSVTGVKHGVIQVNIGIALSLFAQQNNLGVVAGGDVGIYTRRKPDTLRGADVVFISHERYAQRKTPNFFDVAPKLVVEILSPSDLWSTVMKKLQEYFTIGVKMVWIVDSTEQQVFVYRSLTTARYFTESDLLPGDEILPGLELSVATVYANV